jgi:type II secretory pathway pseudopilin PulG
MYHVLKDFAGPVATIIASVTAALITLYFASRQTRIAQQQADTAKQQADTAKRQAETAHARLNLDLYDKRFNIYTTALDLYEADMKKRIT